MTTRDLHQLLDKSVHVDRASLRYGELENVQKIGQGCSLDGPRIGDKVELEAESFERRVVS